MPIPPALRDHLLAHLRAPGVATTISFSARRRPQPFAPKDLTERADVAWTAAKLKRITLHECRHTYACFMIAAGVNAKALCEYMGHASIAITLDRYGHLMPGNEEQAAACSTPTWNVR